jgi:L-fuculose-phosphate aldolase
MTKGLMVISRAVQRESEHELKRLICRVGRSMYTREFVVACEGNLSVRLDADRILLTPAGACKGRLTPEDLLTIDSSGAVVDGRGRPSSEMLMHLLYYRLRPDVQAVCHAHPPSATGFAAAGRALEQPVLPEVVVSLGKIPLAPYGTPGTWELCARLEPLIPKHDAILLENHGVVTCGQDLATAYQRMETVEQFARILLIAEQLGGPRLLSRTEVEKLIAARPRYRVPCPEITEELPLSSESLQAEAVSK